MKTILLFTLLSCWVVFATAQELPEQLFSGLPNDVTPELSERGAYAIGVRTVTIENTKHTNALNSTEKHRKLTLEIWYPSEANNGSATFYANETRSGVPFSIQANAVRDAAILANSKKRFPIIVLSHGYTGYRTIMYHIAEHLASHGYIAVGIDHTDSTNADIDFSKAAGAGFLSTLMNRAKDQQFTLEWILNDSRFSSFADQKNAGLIGYSMGGYGAINTIGGCYSFTAQHTASISGTDDEATNQSLANALNNCAAGRENGADPRWKAAVIMAPWGGQLKVFNADSIAAIDTPSLYIAGNLDDISGYSGIRWLYDSHASADSFLLTYSQARHNIAPHPAPKAAYGNELDIGHYYEPSWDSEALALINQHFTLAMMNCYVKDIASACEYLSVRGTSNQSPEDGPKPAPWKGFNDRYATGMRMEGKTQ